MLLIVLLTVSGEGGGVQSSLDQLACLRDDHRGRTDGLRLPATIPGASNSKAHSSVLYMVVIYSCTVYSTLQYFTVPYSSSKHSTLQSFTAFYITLQYLKVLNCILQYFKI